MTTEVLPGYQALALVGPTATGKTAWALSLAQQVPLEIISMDSALVYQGMDIGTAKPTAAQRQAVPHHLIDICSPTQSYSAASFARDAQALIEAIRARGKLPLLVGGTMLYLKALTQGLDDLPQASPAVRRAIESEAQQKGWPFMHERLALVDPATAARLPPHDAQRISRALEVWQISGQPLSSFFGASRTPGPALAVVSLEPQDRSWLHQRIAQRFDLMLQQDFLGEVRRLRQDYPGLTPDLPSMRCVGYRQAWQHLNGEFGKDELREQGIAATRQLAKRQLTWLRSMPERHRVACDAPHRVEQVIEQAQQAWGPPARG